MQRNAIILEKNLTAGEVGNVAGILMGQIAQINPEVYLDSEVTDADGVRHAAIRYSTVVLKAGSGQIANLAKSLKESETISSCVFTATGQSLNNQFELYQEQIQKSDLENLKPVGIVVSGPDEEVRAVTKKFSLLK